jgi:hypothetical protein
MCGSPCHGVPAFISTAADIIDIGKDLAGADFDIGSTSSRRHRWFLYINWAFPEFLLESAGSARLSHHR